MAGGRGVPVLALAAGLCAGPAGAGPIAAPIPKTGVSAQVEDFVQVPPSNAARPRARLNLMLPAGDGSARLFVNDMRGAIHRIEDGAVAATPFLDVASALGGALDTAGLQVGVSTFAFHPDFSRPGAPGSGLFYTAHSEVLGSGTPDFSSPTGASSHHSVLAEWRLHPADPDRIDPASRREILRVEEPTADHNIGQIGFDPNARPGDADYGMLYVALGDGGYPAGPVVDPNGTAQDPSNPFGSILRIDPLGTSSPERPTNGRYGIPADNPLLDGSEGALGEIWAYGLRNPHRFSWDSGGDGAMLISDIGQSNVEEVNLGMAGANYGWSRREGTFVLDPADPSLVLPLPDDDASLGFTYPVAQYDHDEGAAIVGGFVYRGRALPQLEGRYVFGDLVNGRIFFTEVDALVPGSPAQIEELTLFHEGVETTLLEILGDSRADLRFGLDEAGEIYLLTKRDGVIRRLVPEPATASLLALGLAALAARRAGERGSKG